MEEPEGKIIYRWENSNKLLRSRIIQNEASEYIVIRDPEVDGGVVVFGKFKKEWHPNPSARCLIRNILSDLATYKAGNVPVTKIISDNEGLANDIEDLKEDLAVLQEQTRWIPVGERLPEERDEAVAFRSESVWVWHTRGATRKAYYMTRQRYWKYEYGIGQQENITHWMPIPQLPKEDNGKE